MSEAAVVEDVNIDMDAANKEMSDAIVSDLGGKPAAEEVVVEPKEPTAATVVAPTTRTVPKSWKPEYHEAWSKLDPKVQEYVEQRETEMASGIESVKGDAQVGRSIREVIAPYRPLLDSQGVKDESQAVRALLNAHYQLSTGDENARTALFASLAKQYHIDVAKLSGSAAVVQDPALREVTDRLSKVEGSLTAAQQAQVESLRQQTSKEVEIFAADPTHPYFNEVADHIVLLLQDPRISLKDAYDQAVWANPATRAKEQARLSQEAEAKLRKDAEEAAAKARKAKGTDVRGKEGSKSSTELLGTMEDTMREAYREINART